jgi:hypothetical protein
MMFAACEAMFASMTPITDLPGIYAMAARPKPAQVPQPVAPSTPQGVGVVRSSDHRLGDFSGRLA